MQPVPQSASDIPFRTPMAAIWHFAFLGLKPERSKNLPKAFITSITESQLPQLQNNIASLAWAERKNTLLKILMPLIFYFL